MRQSRPGCRRRPVHTPPNSVKRTQLPSALLIVVAAGLGACKAVELPVSTTTAVTASTTPDWSAFTLGPGDILFMSVVGMPEITIPEAGVRVSPDGTLSLPFLGPITAEGKSVEELRVAIEAGLSEYYHEPAVMLSLVEYGSRRFYLFGDIKKPGPQAMDRPITALEALSYGGGLEAGANAEEVVVIRKHATEEIEVFTFNARTPGPGGLVQIRPDDLVFVSRDGVGVFSENVTPYLQGLGYSIAQVAALIIAYDRVSE